MIGVIALSAFRRWLKFNLVGFIGIGVQLVVLTGLMQWLRLGLHDRDGARGRMHGTSQLPVA